MSDPDPGGSKEVYLPIINSNDVSGAESPPPWKPTPKPTKTPKPTNGPPPTATPTDAVPPPPGATPTEPPRGTQRVAIDPITRIEGHLRLEVQIENGRVTDAWSAGMMFRGIELLMPGRDPRDAWVFAQRICGV